jgi:hypothetical protein
MGGALPVLLRAAKTSDTTACESFVVCLNRLVLRHPGNQVVFDSLGGVALMVRLSQLAGIGELVNSTQHVMQATLPK